MSSIAEQIKVLDNLPGVYQFYDFDENDGNANKLRIDSPSMECVIALPVTRTNLKVRAADKSNYVDV